MENLHIADLPKLRSSDSVLHAVKVEELPVLWNDTAHHLKLALDHSYGEYSLSSLYEAISDNSMQLWVSLDSFDTVEAALITQILDFPNVRICQMLMCGGREANNWAHFKEIIEDWAAQIGCQAVELVGRRGWKKYFKDYEELYTTLRKGVGDASSMGHTKH